MAEETWADQDICSVCEKVAQIKSMLVMADGEWVQYCHSCAEKFEKKELS